MAKIVITQPVGKNYYQIDLNDYAVKLGVDTIFFWAEDITSIDTDGHVTINVRGIKESWNWSFDTEVDNVRIVDSVMAVAPTSNVDLATKIANLKG